MKRLHCYPKELLRKVPRVNLKNLLASVDVAVKLDIKKPLVEYPSASCADVSAMKRINVFEKPHLNSRPSAETGESNLAEDLLTFLLRW